MLTYTFIIYFVVVFIAVIRFSPVSSVLLCDPTAHRSGNVSGRRCSKTRGESICQHCGIFSLVPWAASSYCRMLGIRNAMILMQNGFYNSVNLPDTMKLNLWIKCPHLVHLAVNVAGFWGKQLYKGNAKVHCPDIYNEKSC